MDGSPDVKGPLTLTDKILRVVAFLFLGVAGVGAISAAEGLEEWGGDWQEASVVEIDYGTALCLYEWGEEASDWGPCPENPDRGLPVSIFVHKAGDGNYVQGLTTVVSLEGPDYENHLRTLLVVVIPSLVIASMAGWEQLRKGISGSDPPTAPSGTRRPWRRWALSLVVIALAYLLGQRVAEQEGQADMDTMWSDLRLGDCIHDVWADHYVVVPCSDPHSGEVILADEWFYARDSSARPRTRSLIGKQPQQKRPCTPTPASRQAAGRMTTWSKDRTPRSGRLASDAWSSTEPRWIPVRTKSKPLSQWLTVVAAETG